MIGRKLSNFGVLHEVGPFLKSAHIGQGLGDVMVMSHGHGLNMVAV